MKIANGWTAANGHIGQSPIAIPIAADIQRQIDVHWGERGWVCFDFEELPKKFLGIRLRQQEARRCVHTSLAVPCDRAWEKDRFVALVRIEPDSVGAILTRCACALAAPAMRPLTHMCYSEFNDIIAAIGAMDADVISIETARSKMELLNAFATYEYPNEIGPGVYDIHSPRIPATSEMEELLIKAGERLSARQLWVNPDCGLKTRKWEDVKPALVNMVDVAKAARAALVQLA
ncbi:hypothetical protein [Sphingomonas sp.]|uniref:hypothetical protein n=1 Tax=Sphingomonas sp. TaxID=28214 RepID=UPI002C9A91F4|nr:hypothetical protein [Sphingomonas sp.]HWK36291.1 hypothetical protein [Sphingomonas sp.]